MLDDAEFKACFAEDGPFADAINGRAARRPVLAKQQLHARVLERYRSTTGLNEPNINAVYHYRLSLTASPDLLAESRFEPHKQNTAHRPVLIRSLICHAVNSDHNHHNTRSDGRLEV